MGITIFVIILLVLILAFLIIFYSPSLNLKMLLFLIKPHKPYEVYKIPVPPDYSKLENWAAHPSEKDYSDLVPEKSSLINNQENALVDVFYVHFTTHISRKSWNAYTANKSLNKRTDKYAVRNQASIFNESCKIYAPRYRQATLYSFFDTKGNGKQALDLAYQDIKTAFSYYLNHFNNGRPIVIASHSQGTEHTTRLLKEFFDGKELCSKLVVAYLVGMPVKKGIFRGIPPSDSAEQTGCFASWSVFGWNIKPNYFQNEYKASVCTNPLTWKTDCTYGGKEKNLGGVSSFFKRIDKNIVDAQCSNGVLWIHTPKKIGYISLPPKNYVLMDYNLFYMDVRENVRQRIESYFNLH